MFSILFATLLLGVVFGQGPCEFTIAVVPTPVCQGHPATLVVVPTEPNEGFQSFLWSTGETTQSIVVTEEKEYNVTLSDSSVPCSETRSTTLTKLPLSVTLNGGGTFCGDAGLELSAEVTDGVAPFMYKWNTPNGDVETSSATFQATVPGSYFVSVTDNNTCTSTSNLVQVQVDTLQVTLNGPDKALCIQGGAPRVIDTSVVGGVGQLTYFFFTPSSNLSASQDSVLTVTQAGDYSVRVVDSLQCSGSSNDMTVQMDSLDISASATIEPCGTPGVISTTVTPGRSPYQYRFTLPNGTEVNQASGSLSTTEAGTYFVRVQDANDCVADTSVSYVCKGQPCPVDKIEKRHGRVKVPHQSKKRRKYVTMSDKKV